MSIARRVILGVALVSGVAFIWPCISGWTSKQLDRYRSDRDISQATRCVAYALDQDQWIEFGVPAEAQSLRIVTNAVVGNDLAPETTVEQARPGWRYAIEYELIDERGRIIDRRDYHLRTTMGPDQRGDEERTLTWLANSDQQLTPARTIQIPWPQTTSDAIQASPSHEARDTSHYATQPHRIRLRSRQMDRPLTQLIARVYMRHERVNYAQPYVWGRLSADRRRQITRASVFPSELLSPTERQSLLRELWTALPPRQRAGGESRDRHLYQRNVPATEEGDNPSVDLGIVLGAHRPATIPLLPTDGRVRLACNSVGHQEVQVRIRWYPPRDSQQPLREWEWVWREQELPSSPWEFAAQGGLLEVVANHSVQIVPTWSDTTRENLQLPTGNSSLRSQWLDTDAEVTYRVSHSGDEPTPCRVSVRRALPWNEEQQWSPTVEPAPIQVEWLDDKDAVLRHFIVYTSADVSLYDRATRGQWTLDVSEAAHFHWAIPARVSKLRVRNLQHPVLLSCAVRPLTMARSVNLGDSDEATRDTESPRNWFLIRPEGAERRRDDNDTALVSVATRPPVYEVDEEESHRVWEDMVADGPARGRFILTPRWSSIAPSENTWRVLSCEIPLHTACTVKWQPGASLTSIRPRLTMEHGVPFESFVTVLVDGREVLRHQLRSHRGQIELPSIPLPLNAPTSTIQIHGPQPMRCFLSHAQRIDDDQLFIQQFAYHLSDEGLRFPIHKQSTAREGWTLRIFAEGSTPEAVDVARSETQSLSRLAESIPLDVTIEGIPPRDEGPYDAWTVAERRVSLFPGHEVVTLAIGGSLESYDAGTRYTIWLGTDTPPGNYAIVVRPVRIERRALAVGLGRWVAPDATRYEVERLAE